MPYKREQTMNPLWRYATGIAGFLCIMLGIALVVERAHSRKQAARIVELSATIQRLEDEGKQKQSEVREVIKAGKERVVVVEREAKRIEQAPLPGNCRTPVAVMGADL